MKDRIIVKKKTELVEVNGKMKEKDFLKFFLKNDSGETWLFNQKCTEGVYEWFKNGRSINEVRKFVKWNRNKRLEQTISRIPREVKYVEKYVLEYERVA